MNQPPAMILRVRFKSGLPFDEVKKIVEERAPEFEALTGLQQKYYLQDPESGEVAGLYIWESAEALGEFRESELRASIAKAYRVQGEPHIEVYKVFKVLRDDST
jgi:heme-degrading monooxygenase HmoA